MLTFVLTCSAKQTITFAVHVHVGEVACEPSRSLTPAKHGAPLKVQGMWCVTSGSSQTCRTRFGEMLIRAPPQEYLGVLCPIYGTQSGYEGG